MSSSTVEMELHISTIGGPGYSFDRQFPDVQGYLSNRRNVGVIDRRIMKGLGLCALMGSLLFRSALASEVDPGTAEELHTALCLRAKLASKLETLQPGSPEYADAAKRLGKLNQRIGTHEGPTQPISNPYETKPVFKIPLGFQEVPELALPDSKIKIRPGITFIDKTTGTVRVAKALFSKGPLGLVADASGKNHSLSDLFIEVPSAVYSGSPTAIEPGTRILIRKPWKPFEEKTVHRVYMNATNARIITSDGRIHLVDQNLFQAIPGIEGRSVLTSENQLLEIRGLFMNRHGDFRVRTSDQRDWSLGTFSFEIPQYKVFKPGVVITSRYFTGQDVIKHVFSDGTKVRLVTGRGFVIPAD